MDSQTTASSPASPPRADRERIIIREAMDRLLDGAALHSDGKLTIKSLAAEAQVKRWVLTHKHPDLQEEFRARVAGSGGMSATERVLREEVSELKGRLSVASAKYAVEHETVKRLERVVQVLTLENERLREQCQKEDGTPHLRPVPAQHGDATSPRRPPPPSN